MKICLISIRKDDSKAYKEAVEDYEKRIKRYTSFEHLILTVPKKIKSMPIPLQKTEEGKILLGELKDSDYVVILDEKGKQKNSQEFAQYLERKLTMSYSRLVFVIGGPFGFSEAAYARANEKMALSKMTFSHQMIRLFIVEQIYRGLSILNGGKYHHD